MSMGACAIVDFGQNVFEGPCFLTFIPIKFAAYVVFGYMDRVEVLFSVESVALNIEPLQNLEYCLL
jgi:hypothetical protein